MTRRPAAFTQKELERVFKAAQKAGIEIDIGES